MLKEHNRILTRLKISLDLAVLAGAFYLAYALRSLLPNHQALSELNWALPVFMLIWILLLHYFGIYESLRTIKIPAVFAIVLKSAGLGFLLFTATAYIMKASYVNRFFTVFIFSLGSLLIAIEKIIVILISRSARKKGYNYRNILIVGSGKRAQKFINVINKHSEWGLRIVGLVDDDKEKVGQIICDHVILGTFQDLSYILHNGFAIDEVVFVIPRSWLNRVSDAIRLCETEGVRIHMAVDYFDLDIARAKTTELNGFPLVTFETTPDKVWHLIIKRSMDVVISTLSLIILSPVFLLITSLIKLTSKGPVVFQQTRCGLNGRKFTLYKFRTMVVDAENKLKELMDKNQMKGPVFKLDNDPRLTSIGKFLRKLSLDELPQLWNVFKGDMSIVGPRPPIPKEVEEYESWHRRRLSMRPGITCLWQVNGRNNITDFNDWTKLDLYYIDNWSLWLDCKIMLKTIPTVLSGVGAK